MAFGPETLPITYTVENDTVYDRTEVVGLVGLFPDDANSITEADLIANYHMYLEGGRETIGFGQGYTNSSQTFSTTLPWVASLNGITAASGNIQPGSIEITVYSEGYQNGFPGSFVSSKATFTDTPVNSTTGQFVHSNILSSSINYTTGVITLVFNTAYTPISGKPIRLKYKFANPVKYPTQWTVLRTWPSGRVRQAKAWVGQSSGVGMFLSRKITTITTTPVSAQTPEYTRVYLRVGKDAAVNTALPTYTVHASLATALNSGTSSMQSQVFDSNGLDYYAGLLAGQPYEENVLEDPALNGGKGWMKVFQRRNYHTISVGGAKFGSLTRDFLSVTSYIYVPHNQRFFEKEVRLGNDYQGADPYEHTTVEALGTANGFTTTFSTTVTNVFPSSDGVHGHLRKGRVKILRDGVVVATDAALGNGVLVGESGINVSASSINYATGQISITFSAPPLNGAVFTCSYKSYYIKVGTATGVQTLNFTLEQKPSQYGTHIRVGGGGTALYEGWDGGGSYGAAANSIVPYVYTTTQPVQVLAAPLSTTSTGSVAGNLVPGTVGFFADTSVAGTQATWFCRDNGTGGLVGRNVSTGTIDYVTGAYSITFSSAPTGSFNLYATYGATTGARPISGTLTYATKALSVTTSQSVPASTPVFVSYIRNNLASKSHDPNMHPLGSVGLDKWVMLWNGTQFTDLMCEGSGSYNTSVGGTTNKFATILSPTTPPGGADTSLHEHMHDGTSITRIFFAYAGTGASGAENNSWAAKKVHAITPVPTLEAYSSTRAYGLLEGGLKIQTPDPKGALWEMNQRAYTEDLGRSVIGTVEKNGQFACKDSWNNGSPRSSVTGSEGYSGVRGGLNWRENQYVGVNSGGAQRALHDASVYFLYSQAWQGVRFLYHAALWATIRPGAMFWNFANRTRWADRAYHVYLPTNGQAGMCNPRSASALSLTYTYNSQEFIGRGWKFGFGVGRANVVNGSTRVEFTGLDPNVDPNTGAVTLDNRLYQAWISSDPNTGVGGAFFTPNGTNQLSGRRRIAIQGSDRQHTITDVYHDNVVSRWVAILDSAYTGPTASGLAYGLHSEPRPGQDIVDQRNDPRSYPAAKIGCGRFSLQHGIEGDSSSHQSSWAAFDVWNCNGSWALWDIVRTNAEWNMVSVKETVNGGFYADQMRTNAWGFRAVISAYTVTKALAGRPGFSFLADPVYGESANRYAEWIRTRWTQWLDRGARGEMDPGSSIAVGGKERIRDIRVSSSSSKADWNSMANLSSPNPAYGGTGSFNGTSWVGATEAEVRFGPGFDYVSVWEIGYLMPWMGGTYREFRFDNTPVKLPIRGEPDTAFSSVILRVFNGYAAFACDYAFMMGDGYATQRGSPGFISLSVAGNPDTRLANGNNNWNRNYDLVIDPSVGTPIAFVSGTPPDINVTKTYESIAWPTTSSNYIAQQIYWLRGASKAFSGVNESIDRLGHPIPGKGSFTSFEGGWHDPGLPFVGNPMIPSGATNPVNISEEIWPIVRAPVRGESFNLVGLTWLDGTVLLWSCAPFLTMVARFSSSGARRAKAGDILNRLLWQTKAASLLRTGYTNVNDSGEGEALETNYFAGPITGDFPYSTDAGGQPVDRWWTQTYYNRRRLTSDTLHVAQVGDLDIFKINLTSYSIPTRFLQQDGSDTRVVRQLADGTNQVCKSTTRRNASGSWSLYVTVPVSIGATQAISGSSTTEAWYLYYGSTNPGSNSWTNTNSIDGPYALDAATRTLWNQNGNYTTDAGPNNWSLTTFTLLEPDYVDGYFGGAVSINRHNLDVAFSPQSGSLAKPSSSQFLAGAFAYDFWFNVSATDIEVDRTGNYGIFSLADTDAFPALCYLANPTNSLIFSCSLGGAASGYSVHTVTAPGPTRQVIGTGNGSLTSFTANIGIDRVRGRVAVTTGNGLVYAQDNGIGGFTGVGVLGSSTIDYTTGAITINTTAAVPNTVPVVAYSIDVNSRWAPGVWNHARITYNGSRILIAVNGSSIGTVSSSGSIQPLPEASPSGVCLGSFFTVGSGFLAHSVIRLAEFRISSSDRNVPVKSATPLAVTLLTEESLLISGSTQAGVGCYVAPLNTASRDTTLYVALERVDAVVRSVAMEVYVGIGTEHLSTVDMAVAASPQTSSTAEMYVAVGKTSTSPPVTAYVSRLVGYEGEPVEGLVVILGSSVNAVSMNVLALKAIINKIDMTVIGATTIFDKQKVDCAIRLESATEASSPVAGYILASYTAFSPVQMEVYAARLLSNRVDALVAQSGLPFSNRVACAVQISSLTSLSSVSCFVAGPSGSQAESYIAGTVALPRSVTGPVAMHVYLYSDTGSVVTPVSGSVVVMDRTSNASVNMGVAVGQLLQSPPVVGSVQTSPVVSATVSMLVQRSNIDKFNLVSLAVMTSGVQTAAVVGETAIAKTSSVIVGSSVQTAGEVSRAVAMRVQADTISIANPVDMCVLRPDPSSLSQQIAGQVSLAREISIPVGVNFSELVASQMSCGCFISAWSNLVVSSVGATLALKKVASNLADGVVARTRSRKATIRCLVVRDRSNTLTASSVDFVTPETEE